MGRPIKKTFFGNLNREFYGSVPRLSGVGGEGALSVSISNSGTNYSAGATAVFTAPDITGGIRPTASVQVGTGVLLGNILSISITDSGSGYNNAPTLTITTASSVSVGGVSTNNSFTLTNIVTAGIYAGMKVDAPAAMQASTYVASVGTNTVTLTKTQTATSATNSFTFNDYGSSFGNTVTLTSSRLSAIQIISYLTTGSSAISGGDIVKQESSRRYLINNAQGQGQCRLVTGVLAPGQMHIIATDWGGATYYVTKLTAHRAIVTPRTSTSTAYISTGSSAAWTIGAATGTGVSAVLSLSHTA